MSGARAITYCSNIHPGEAWADVLRNLEDHALYVKRAVSPQASFPLGLRISAQAAFELQEAQILHFREWCAKHDCYVLTVNGFPYGQFHGTQVKEAVYDPDWRYLERVQYTQRLADILARWVDPNRSTSISTVPIAFRGNFESQHWGRVREHLCSVLEHLARIYERGGPHISLALEPEPHCVLETTADVLECFERLRLPQSLMQHLGICFDCCHQAVEFEEPSQCLQQLASAGINIIKVQVSSALRAYPQELAALLEFDEPTYLHQVVARTAGKLERFADLPHFRHWLDDGNAFEECRVHFHVPIFLPHLGSVGTTRFFLEDLLPRLHPVLPLEVETYSFGVLPLSQRKSTVAEAVTRELLWVREVLNAAHGSH